MDYKLNSEKIEKKLRLAESLFNFAFEVKSHQIQKKNPLMPIKKVRQLTYDLMIKASKS